jgi:uncharacterized protein YgbK (DUF1537 family)
VREFLVAADDRTGALEAAAELAGVVGPVAVHVESAPTRAAVVDLGTRHLNASDAAARAASVDDTESAWTAHKIDSTLRGNWAAELRARQSSLRRPVLLVAAWPAMGRTCRRGVVRVHGEPVADVRDGIAHTRLLTVDELSGWSPTASEVACVDIADDDELTAAASLAASLEVLIAGPAGAIGAAFTAGRRRGHPLPPSAPPTLAPPALVVCGSAHPVSREQIDRVRTARPDVEVVATPVANGDLHTAHALAVAETARERLTDVVTLVIIGGDTAAALLGPDPRIVHGYAAPGMPWSADPMGLGPVVVTKAGGFGGPDALVELLRGL